jgi:hypothetical protein
MRFWESAVLFHYYQEHQYSNHAQIWKPITRIEPSPGMWKSVMQTICYALGNYGSSLTTKLRQLCVFLFYVLDIRGRSQELKLPSTMKWICVYTYGKSPTI